MKFNIHSLAIKQSLLILLGISAIFLTLFLSFRSIIGSNMTDILLNRGQEISEKNVSVINNIFTETADLGELLADHLELIKSDDDKTILPLIQNSVASARERVPQVVAMVVALAPKDAADTVGYMRVSYYKDGEIHVLNDSNYVGKSWYEDPKTLGKSSWREPFVGDFFTEPITVYSVPFYRKNSRGENVFAGVVCIDLSLAFLREAVSSISIPDSGYGIIFSGNNTIVAHPKEDWIFKESISSISEKNGVSLSDFEHAIRAMDNGLLITQGLDGKEACIYFTPMQIEGWKFCIAWPTQSFFAQLRAMESFFGILSGGGYAIMLILILIISLRVAKPLRRLSYVANELGRGNFNVKIPKMSGKDEVALFSDAFSRMRSSLVQYISNLKKVIAENERMESELNVARKIQMSALPQKSDTEWIEKDVLDVNNVLIPAKEVGGDFFDYYQLDDEHFAFLIADVSGKGIPAAMFLMSVRTLLKTVVLTGAPLNEAFNQANDRVAQKNPENMFVTIWMGILNVKTGHVDFVSAGHNPPVIRHTDGSVEFAKSKASFVFGGMEGVRYKLQSLDLQKGDKLFLYTDGVTEATNAKDELFGDDRLLDAAKQNGSMCENVKSAIDSFAKEAPQFDDITMLTIRYNG